VLELVGEYGERLTIDDIASRAKVARKTIFRRFGSKEALLDIGRRRQFERAQAPASVSTAGSANSRSSSRT